MKSSIRNLSLFVSGLLIAVVFQNCGQPGALTESGSSLAKSDAPLVVDVIAEMENQQPPAVVPTTPTPTATPRHAEVEHEEDHDSREHIAPVRHRDLVREDDVVYDNDLENVLRDHSCQNNQRKILICHYPPGNAAARHEICISRSALRAHMNHGGSQSAHQDHLGACDYEDEEDN